ncbi:hypothetical protein [Brevundimonas faecalis]|uniref:Uncharacterized protein n=1 Tax=Brevundimonas faecalis TaxID=947378 RepID=A0ABV2RAB0_9CAUL
MASSWTRSTFQPIKSEKITHSGEGLKAASHKKASQSIAVQKNACGGAREVSRSGRIHTDQKSGPKW